MTMPVGGAGGAGGGLNVQSLVSHTAEASQQNMQNVANLAQNLDFTDPGSMAQMQMAMMKMNMGFQMEAAMVKSIEDMLKSVVQRM